MKQVYYDEGYDTASTHGSEKRVGEKRFEYRRKRGFGDDTDRDARSRDTNLTACKIYFEIVRHLPSTPQTRLVELRLGVLSHTRKSELDCDEEAVCKYEQKPGNETKNEFYSVHLQSFVDELEVS
jgi:hypothetical protein